LRRVTIQLQQEPARSQTQQDKKRKGYAGRFFPEKQVEEQAQRDGYRQQIFFIVLPLYLWNVSIIWKIPLKACQ
jgi:hypothetical protein